MADQADPKPRYQTSELPMADRIEDLLSRMSIAEKAGQMFISMIAMGEGGSLAGRNEVFDIDDTVALVTQKHLTHFNLLGTTDKPSETADWHNKIQTLALEKTKLGIPITISTDPRHHFSENVGTSFAPGAFSQWPETLGFAALNDPALVEEFARIVREEYLALGLRCALHPQADLATEPRWSRISLTFGESADLASDLVEAYIRGLQGTSLDHTSVAAMVKHFPGGGPQLNGEDPHFVYGKEQVYPGNNIEYHLKPFERAIKAGVASIMPYYGMPKDTEHEEVGFAFNKSIITGLLRQRFGYDGVVCTDWGLITDTSILGQPMPARAWGCENLSELERVKKILEAGCDQFGGEARPELVIELVEKGLIPESRIDESIRRILRQKFQLGLFDDRFVDASKADQVVGRADFRSKGEAAQRDSYTLLQNKNDILPLAIHASTRIYTEGIPQSALDQLSCIIVSHPKEADIALLRLRAPYEPRPGGFEAKFHAGSLEFAAKEKARQANIYTTVPTIVDIYLDRPAIIPEILDGAAAVLANYGSSPLAFLDIVTGKAEPKGHLPFDLPSSTAAIEASRSDVPFDTEKPLLRFGHGLKYAVKGTS